MNNPLGEGFVKIRCCEDHVGYANARRFIAIQNRLGNAWVTDPEASTLMADPNSYGSPQDGTPISFSCSKCGARFAWAEGIPKRVSSS